MNTERVWTSVLLFGCLAISADAEPFRVGPSDVEGIIERHEQRGPREDTDRSEMPSGNRRHFAHYKVMLIQASATRPDWRLEPPDLRILVAPQTDAKQLRPGQQLRVVN